MESELNRAHCDVLELLKIVHEFCVKENIAYTIAGDTAINYGKIHFSQCEPVIYVAVFEHGYKKLERYLVDFCEKKAGYSVHNYTNTEQFYTMDLWFVKANRVKLPHKKEEFYYGSKLVVTPLFYAGNSYKDWLKVYRKCRDAIVGYNLPALLPGQPVISRIQQIPKRLRTYYYERRKGQFNLPDTKLFSKNATKYIVYPYCITMFRAPNTMSWIVGKKIYRFVHDMWTDVQLIDFYGVECFCIRNLEEYCQCFPKAYIKKVRTKKSQLITDGGGKLRRVQLIQTELLKEFDRICRKNNLRYNISFGTLLGAVRHGGFIPWDDDIDVTMPWEDYNKLDEVMRRDLDKEKYYYRTPETEENNHLIFKHLERRGTLYTKPGREKLEHEIGVFIDIFPMYPAAPNFLLDWFHAKVCQYWRTALWATVGADSEPNRLRRAYYHFISRSGNTKCYQKFVEAAMLFKNTKGNYKFWIAMDRNPYNVALVQKQNYDDVVEVDFEGAKFLAPRNYEEVLNYCFGEDWKRYPGTNKRVPAHNAIVEIGNLYETEAE